MCATPRIMMATLRLTNRSLFGPRAPEATVVGAPVSGMAFSSVNADREDVGS